MGRTRCKRWVWGGQQGTQLWHNSSYQRNGRNSRRNNNDQTQCITQARLQIESHRSCSNVVQGVQGVQGLQGVQGTRTGRAPRNDKVDPSRRLEVCHNEYTCFCICFSVWVRAAILCYWLPRLQTSTKNKR